MITHLDEAIKQLLVKRGAIDLSEVDISFVTPDREWSTSISKPTINFYLYDIRENHSLRGTEWFVEKDRNGIATRKKNPSRVDLSYLVSIWTNDIDDEHRLLWHVLATLFRYRELPHDLLSGPLATQQYPIKMMAGQPDGLFNNPAEFWEALDNKLKPSINCVITLPLDTDLEFTAPVVRTKIVDFKAPDTNIERLVQISGVVHEAGKPDQGIAGATVVAKEARMTADSDDQGYYSFPRIPEGKYTFQILVAGKKVQESPVTVPAASYDLEISESSHTGRKGGGT